MGNAVVKPMLETLYSLPWAANGQQRVGEVYCETFWSPPFHNGARQEACPRYVARRQLDRLTSLGYQLYSGFEAKFIVCDSTGNRPIFSTFDVLLSKRLAEYEEFNYSMDKKMVAAGIDVSTFQMEYDAGQFELVMAPKFGIEAADQMFKFKGAVKEMFQQHEGWRATFMTKPFSDSLGSALHYSHSLWSVRSNDADDAEVNRNALYDPDTERGLSDVGHHWLAGLIRHGRALTALCSPTINCYRRLHEELAPFHGDWGVDDRSAMIRAKTGNLKATYFESRLPSGSCNPYIGMAATVAAGLDGIVNKLECPAPRVSVSSPSAWSEKLPESLSEALEALETDDVIRSALGDEFIRWFVQAKQSEVDQMEAKKGKGLTDIEIEREIYSSL